MAVTVRTVKQLRAVTPARQMLVLACCGLAATGCTAASHRIASPSRPPAHSVSAPPVPSPAPPSPSASPSRPAGTCPWNDRNHRAPSLSKYGISYVRLNASCLVAGAQSGLAYTKPRMSAAARSIFYYNNGTKVQVTCVQPHGQPVTDIAGTTSATWVKFFASAKYLPYPLSVYVPYAAVGYARVRHAPTCHGKT